MRGVETAFAIVLTVGGDGQIIRFQMLQDSFAVARAARYVRTCIMTGSAPSDEWRAPNDLDFVRRPGTGGGRFLRSRAAARLQRGKDSCRDRGGHAANRGTRM